MRRLTNSEIKVFRLKILKQQNYICPLCQTIIDTKEAVLDHCHKTGECRGVLHRGCNALVGKVENNRAMNKMTDDAMFQAWSVNLPLYIDGARLGVLYPTHKTEVEKKELAKKRAKKKRLELKRIKNESSED